MSNFSYYFAVGVHEVVPRVLGSRIGPMAHYPRETESFALSAPESRRRSVSHVEDVSEYIIGCVLNANHAPLAHVFVPSDL